MAASSDKRALPTENVEGKKKRKKDLPAEAVETPPVEIGGPKGPEPTRYGDWEHKGRCSDF